MLEEAIVLCSSSHKQRPNFLQLQNQRHLRLAHYQYTFQKQNVNNFTAKNVHHHIFKAKEHSETYGNIFKAKEHSEMYGNHLRSCEEILRLQFSKKNFIPQSTKTYVCSFFSKHYKPDKKYKYLIHTNILSLRVESSPQNSFVWKRP